MPEGMNPFSALANLFNGGNGGPYDGSRTGQCRYCDSTYCSIVLCYSVMCEGRYFYAYAVEIATDCIVAISIAD
jgi:hypothetical protein